ncbi:hypothetical protein B0J11DRAFT_301931 [Dendryphion nanum]|uniref:F-box protein n=1 Tax=Dendryphion nanum TaxID=256645 RepID=A0A9P9DUJ3_9PLEO|nr:hypothetical protein B0J11DRAFT_301931 [Dendryphion nanum]
MVNSKNVAFKVDKQKPNQGLVSQPYAGVINCRKPRGKRALKPPTEVKSQQVPMPAALLKLSGVAQAGQKRKRDGDATGDDSQADSYAGDSLSRNASPASSVLSTASARPFPTQKANAPKPTKLRRGKTLSKGVDLDCWFTILSFSDPAQLLEMRSKIASCYRFLRNNPALWKHSRSYYYGDDLPNPTKEINEFQYAQLRHGHGCMSCGAPSTRKTYWAFLRRWCKACLQSKTIKETDALALFKGASGVDTFFIQKCLPTGIIDSWGNFVGAGPAQTHSLKTVYLASDVNELVAEYVKESQENPASWHAEIRTWISAKQKIVDDRRVFAKKMESWEDTTRASKSFEYQGKKDARKLFYLEKASQLSPPITLRQLERCPAFRRAIVIPKEPSMTSWLQLKPKLEKEVESAREGLSRELYMERPPPQYFTTPSPDSDMY